MLAPGTALSLAEIYLSLGRYEDALNHATLAREAGVSASHLQREFKRILGVSPREFQTAERQRRLGQRLRKVDGVGKVDFDYVELADALGWGMTGELHAYRFRPESLGEVGRGALVVRAGADDVTAIAGCYSRSADKREKFAAKYDLPLAPGGAGPSTPITPRP